MIVADTSVIVAALAGWHTLHDLADAALPSVGIAHTLVEAYSVLTRLPEPQRAAPAAAQVSRRATPREACIPLGGRRAERTWGLISESRGVAAL
mgnify:CR=1 FL=1